jgi:hypothetical protein
LLALSPPRGNGRSQGSDNKKRKKNGRKKINGNDIARGEGRGRNDNGKCESEQFRNDDDSRAGKARSVNERKKF